MRDSGRWVSGRVCEQSTVGRSSLRLIGFTVVTFLLLAATSSCSYLAWRRQKTAQRRALEERPWDLALRKEYAPQDCFGLTGRLSIPPGAETDFLVVAFDHERKARDLVASHEVSPHGAYYGVLVPSGSYDVLLFADLNHNGFYDTDEVVARTPPEDPVLVSLSQSSDGVLVRGPSLTVDLRKPQVALTLVRIRVDPQPYVVASVQDPIFSPELGQLGVYQPNRFLARTQRWAFSIGEPDFEKVQVVLVHGINGTPRDFQTLIAGLDPARYHVWLFYYPSGLSLEQLGIILAGVLENIALFSDVPPSHMQMAVVAHSLGGLVGRRGVNEVCRTGRPPYLRLYASFDTPYGGVDQAQRAVNRGSEIVPSWRDVAVGSDFLTRLHGTPLPKDLPFQLLFGWGKDGSRGPNPAGDGTISLSSQLDPRAQEAATGIEGFEATHSGILADPSAIEALSKCLAATTGSGH